MLPRDQLVRLSEEQEKSLLESESTIDKLKRYKSDYQKVSQQLKSLPDKLEYKMMIPFGRKAFIPGKLVHTNEILVLLGENWFIECSAKYASEIAERRIVQVDRQIVEVSKEHENVSSHLKYSKEFSGVSGDGDDIHEILEYEDEHGEITTIKGPNSSDSGTNGVMTKEEQREAIAKVEAEFERLEALEDSCIKSEETTAYTRDIKSPTIRFHHSNIEIENIIPLHPNTPYQSPADIYDRSPDIMRKVQDTQQEHLPAKKVTWGENSIETIESKVKENTDYNTEEILAQKAFTNIVKERSNFAPVINPEAELPKENRIVSKFKSSRQNK
ncbi:Unconventional prefoldin RPB5 interactor 1-like [Oopsacas minuta]|uniref:Unconventional prefoldin RPB5 interactor 1-like n=1 Tax=Oopsacas minuta TaxID=111878 RepID=A0AAV7JYW9_9METZ|nr:Unconventional prefoldin RPB5 interactor 1-like [Oopsacas minuta]